MGSETCVWGKASLLPRPALGSNTDTGKLLLRYFCACSQSPILQFTVLTVQLPLDQKSYLSSNSKIRFSVHPGLVANPNWRMDIFVLNQSFWSVCGICFPPTRNLCCFNRLHLSLRALVVGITVIRASLSFVVVLAAALLPLLLVCCTTPWGSTDSRIPFSFCDSALSLSSLWRRVSADVNRKWSWRCGWPAVHLDCKGWDVQTFRLMVKKQQMQNNQKQLCRWSYFSHLWIWRPSLPACPENIWFPVPSH